MLKVVKKDGITIEAFDSNKIKLAVSKTVQSIGSNDTTLPAIVAKEVSEQLPDSGKVSVLDIHTLVENALMDSKAYDIARAYITYRKTHMPDIFRKREVYRPYEYPQMIDYIDAIHASFWTHKSFNLTSSIQDIRVNMTDLERTIVLRSILSIASVEAKVKSFWSKLGDKLPKSEFEELGTTLGSNEVYHAHFYAKILEQLGLNSLFTEVLETSAIKSRIDYMNKALSRKDESDKEYIKALLFFSLFVENVSLFSQFLVISFFNKERNHVSGLAQGISATALEENIHAQVGADITNIARTEHPEWFTKKFEQSIYDLIKEARTSELNILDWIFEKGNLPFLTKDEVKSYIDYRINRGLEMVGLQPIYSPIDTHIDKFDWFEVQTKTTIHRDFFTGHSVNYNKNSMSFDEDSLF